MKYKYKRYYVAVEKAIYARNDNEAKVLAAKFSKENNAVVLDLIERPFATFQGRTVHTGSLTIYENHIIETL